MSRLVTVTLKHDVGQIEARRRVADGFDRLKSALAGGMVLAFSQEWRNPDRLEFTAKGLGQTITGAIDIFPEHVRIEAMLPGLLASIAEAIAGRVEKQGRILLGDQRAKPATPE